MAVWGILELTGCGVYVVALLMTVIENPSESLILSNLLPAAQVKRPVSVIPEPNPFSLLFLNLQSWIAAWSPKQTSQI